MNLADRVAIVTGASRGLGAALAEAFARHGAHVAICARHLDPLEAVAQRLQQHSVKIVYGPLDVSEPEQAASLIEVVQREFGRLDILVNNAAIASPNVPLDELPWEDWQNAMAINVPHAMIRAALPLMRERRYGRIVNVTSGLSVSAASNYGAYCVSKAALNMLTRMYAIELRGTGILVNGVNPGVFHSEMNPHETTPPETVVPDVLHLATLADDGPSGRFFRQGQDLGW